MPIITPERLQADAILPQCLDNQFVSETVLKDMVSRGVDYKDEQIKERRFEDTHVEFLRSLLYSSQVVVNRAYFKNSDYLRAAAAIETGALTALIEKEAVVPFVFRESEISEPLPFTVRDGAGKDEATAELSELLGTHGTYLQLAEEQDRNQERLDELGTNFAGFFTSVLHHNHKKREFVASIAQRLSVGPATAGDTVSPVVPEDVLDRFGHLLAESASYTFALSAALPENKRFGREHIYRKYFAAEGGSIPDGQFKQDLGADRALRLFKKLVDLKYNANLPDMLSRYTLTPASMPGRSALPFEKKGGTSDVGRVLNTLTEFKRAIMDNPPEIVLPRLRGLNLGDIQAIRKLPEWQAFSLSQQTLLASRPAEMQRSFEDFQRKLIDFQRELGRWSNDAGERRQQLRKKCKTSLRLIVTAGAATITMVQNAQDSFWQAIVQGAGATASLETLIPDSVKDYSVKLMVTVHDTIAREIDCEYTHQMEILRQSGNMRRKELVELMQEIQQSKSLHQFQDPGSSEQGTC